MRRLLGMLLGTVVAACKVAPIPPDPPDPTPATGGSGPVLSDCVQAEMRVGPKTSENPLGLDCCLVDGYKFERCHRDDDGILLGDDLPLWQTPGGRSFAAACEYSQSQGRDWRPECIATIASCKEIDSAMRGLTCR